MKTSIKVQNLRCGGCANTITKKLTSIEGVEEVSVGIDTSEISFNAKNESTIANVVQQLKALGYPEETKANSLGLKAKSFVSCATGKLSS